MNGVEFRAKKYVRDLRNDTALGTGGAELRFGTKQLKADRMELDYKTERAFAEGNLQFQDGPLTAVARHASIGLRGFDATLEDATVAMGRLVFTGAVIHRTGEHTFVIEEGSYSSCNLENHPAAEATGCGLDWKIYGRRIHVELEGYAHVYDAILFAKDLPILYLPYFLVPVKGKRSTGLLWPAILSTAQLGTGVLQPFFWAIDRWQDATITPAFYSRAGGALFGQYRYAYSRATFGTFEFAATQLRYGDVAAPYPGARRSSRGPFGWIGEGAVNVQNRISLGDRILARQDIRWVSDPFLTLDFPSIMGPVADLGYLRSAVSVAKPADNTYAALIAQRYGSLVVSKDYGVDGGPVTEAPTALFSVTTTPVWDRYVLFESDVRASHFARQDAIDLIPTNPVDKGSNAVPPRPFQTGDYLRTGSRILAEPRLIANFPLHEGLQFQPLLRGGMRGYRFPSPAADWVVQPYAEIEVPFGLYLQKLYATDTENFNRISHVIQPRIIFGARRESSTAPSHPFFFEDVVTGRSGPRFDVFDRGGSYDYFRLEIINRLRRRTTRGDSSRFFWFQVAQQYNVRPAPFDSRYSRKIGPIEWLSEFTYGGVTAQVQGNYALEPTHAFEGKLLPSPVHEKDVSTNLLWRYGPLDNVRLNGLWRTRANRALSAETVIGGMYKELPTFFDIGAEAEYSLLAKQVRGYSFTLRFRAKPVSCWELLFTTGRNAFRQPFAFFNFRFDFGATKTPL